MKLRKSIIAAACSAGLMFSLAGCGGGADNPASSDGAAGGAGGGDGQTIAVVAKAYGTPFWQAVKAGADDAGKELGYNVTFNGPDNETDTTRQNDLLNQVLAKKPAALVFAALDAKAQEANLQAFASADIPVIAFDSGVPGSDVPITTVSTNNVGAGALAAEKLVDLIGDKGEIAVLGHSQTATTGVDRRDGFLDWLKENAPGIKVVDIQYNASDQAVAQQQATAMMQAHPDLKAFFATNVDGAVAAGQAVKGADKVGDVVVMGFDSGKPQMDMIREGVIQRAVAQNPYAIGYEAVQMAAKAIQGEQVEKFVDSGVIWYDKDTIDDPEVQKSLYN